MNFIDIKTLFRQVAKKKSSENETIYLPKFESKRLRFLQHQFIILSGNSNLTCLCIVDQPDLSLLIYLYCILW